LFLTKASLVFDRDNIRLSSTNAADLSVAIYPAPSSIASDHGHLARAAEGIFQSYLAPDQPSVKFKAELEKVKAAGPVREIPIGKIDQPMAMAPVDADFQAAAEWRIKIPTEANLENDPILRVHYTGDVARLMLNGRLVTDDFYNGNTFEIGLPRHFVDAATDDLRIAIIPLQSNAPVYMAKEARPAFENAESVASIRSVEIDPIYTLQLTPR
jgi:hypothetical protein